ncbi:MAG: hypothetical protein ACRC62_34760 [Microcoleus sp.]
MSFIVKCGRNFLPTFTYQEEWGSFLQNLPTFFAAMLQTLTVRSIELYDKILIFVKNAKF